MADFLARYPYFTLTLAFSAWFDLLNCIRNEHVDWPVPAMAAVAIASCVRATHSQAGEVRDDN